MCVTVVNFVVTANFRDWRAISHGVQYHMEDTLNQWTKYIQYSYRFLSTDTLRGRFHHKINHSGFHGKKMRPPQTRIYFVADSGNNPFLRTVINSSLFQDMTWTIFRHLVLSTCKALARQDFLTLRPNRTKTIDNSQQDTQ